MSELLTREDVANVLKVSPETLKFWRRTGEGPRAIRVGKHLRYRPEDVERYLNEQAELAI